MFRCYRNADLIEVKDIKKRSFYQHKAEQYSWSVRELRKQIKAQLYEHTTPAEIQATSQIKLPAIEAPESFKDAYNFSFKELETTEEKELENMLVTNIELFLKELGDDFSFLGRQVPIKMDNKTHYIDIVLYHRGIPCVVLVDLKAGDIDSGDIGQMNKYVSYYKQNRQYAHEKNTIGLIIGKDAGKEEIRYALDNLEEKIFIATYKANLPTDEKIKKAFKKLK